MRCQIDETSFRQFCIANQLVSAVEYLDTENADVLLNMHFHELPRREVSLWGRVRTFLGGRSLPSIATPRFLAE